MEVILNQISRRYNFNYIFKGVSHHFHQASRTVILGANGSGKSTLLQIIAGALTASDGNIQWNNNESSIHEDDIYKHVAFASPYLELPEEFTLNELLGHHFTLKKTNAGISKKEILELSGLKHAADRRIQYYSSGMKQRVKLCLSILSDAPLLLLDEPLSNLDKKASEWYEQLISSHTDNKTIIVCSNHQEQEFSFCSNRLELAHFSLEK
jgi:ABC-type multidrug transport system ATPase subunit